LFSVKDFQLPLLYQKVLKVYVEIPALMFVMVVMEKMEK
jgi:hypothetical protein